MNNRYLEYAKNSLNEENPIEHTQKNIIPPVGIAHPSLVNSFQENFEDEDKILKDIADLEAYNKETPIQTTKREALSHGARFLEGLGGTVSGLFNALSGEAYFDDNGELLKTEVPMAPTSKDLRGVTKSLTGNYLEPKTERSKNTQEFISDVGSALPIPGMSLIGKALSAGSGQTLKALVQNQGGSESQGDNAKIGLMMVTSLAQIGNAPQFAKRAYNQAINMIPNGTRISAIPTQKALAIIKNQPWYKTGRTTSKGPAFDEIIRIEKKINKGMLDAHEAMQLRRDINEARKKLGAFNYEPGIDKATARRHLDQVDNALTESLSSYGKKSNPEWLRQYNRANQAYSITQRSRQIQDVISSNPLLKPLKSDITKTLFHLGGASAISHAPAIIGAAAPVAAGIKSIQIMNRMIRSPELRNYYLQVLNQATAGNIPAMHKALQRFDDRAMQLEKKNQ